MLHLHHHSDAEAKGEAPGFLSAGEAGYWFWWAKQPGLQAVPLGVYDHPPPEGSSEAIGAIFLGNDDDTIVAGFNVGRLSYDTTKFVDKIHRAIGSLIP